MITIDTNSPHNGSDPVPSVIDKLIEFTPWHRLASCGIVRERVRGFDRTAIVLFGDTDTAATGTGRYYFLDPETEVGIEQIEGLLSALIGRFPKRAARILNDIEKERASED